jgi:hypothetical protein
MNRIDTTTPPLAGLCTSCFFRRTVTSSRGSVFVLCERSKTDLRFPRYPPLPVTSCSGYEAMPARESE